MNVDVVIPCFNGERFLERAIKSVQAQTLKVNQIIVVNDGSTDGSEDILEQLSKSIDNLVVVRQLNSGLSAARNIGINHSRADFIALLDVDDYWSPIKLENQMRYLINNPEKLAVFSSFLESRNGSLTNGRIPPRFISVTPRSILLQLAFFPGSGSSILFRRSILANFGNQLFDTSLKYAEDLDCWIKLSGISDVGILNDRDVVIEIRLDGMQGAAKRNPMPYLINSLNICSKHQQLLNPIEMIFHRYFILFQGLKFDFFSSRTHVNPNELFVFFPFFGRLRNLTFLKIVSAILVPPYYLLRKIVSIY
jgi:glycosyltransferase involved in cell wall biosynthesis